MKRKSRKLTFAPIITLAIVALLATILPFGVVPEVSANPAFTARAETFAQGASVADPFSFTLDVPSGVTNGDILFVFLCIRALTPPTVDSVPAGWQEVATRLLSGGVHRYYLYYKIASSEPANYTWSLTATCKYLAVGSCYTAGDFSVSSLADIAVSNTEYVVVDANLRAASFNVPDANSPMVFFGGVYDTLIPRTFTKPTVPADVWVEDWDYGHVDPDWYTTVCSMIWTGSGNTGDINATISGSNMSLKHAFAVALNTTAGGVSAPTITTSAATSITTITAILNGNVTVTGGENPTVTVYWGLTDGGTNPASWSNNSTPTSPSQPQRVAAFYYNATGLLPNTTYYFSAKGTNSGGTGWGTTQSFKTLFIPQVTIW